MKKRHTIITALLLLTVFFVFSFFFLGDTAQAFTIPFWKIHYAPSLNFKIIAPQLITSPVSGGAAIEDFSFYASATSTVLSGNSTTTSTTNDVVYKTYSPASILYSCILHTPNGVTSYTAVTPSIATVNASGTVSYVSNGTAYFNATYGNITKSVSCSISKTNNQASTVPYSFTAGSLAADLQSEVSSRISGLTPSATTYDIFSSMNNTTHVYTRNTSLFANNVDLTAIPANAGGSGVLIAPDILLQANHYHTGTVYFVDNSNNVYERTVVGGENISGTDIYIARLNSPLPAAITPAAIFDATALTSQITAAAYGDQSGFDIPVVFTNQFRTLRIGNVYTVPTSSYVSIVSPVSSEFSSWYSSPISGDSGSPAMAIVNGKIVVLGVWYTASTVPNVSQYIPQINAAITALGSSYSVTTATTSGFPTY